MSVNTNPLSARTALRSPNLLPSVTMFRPSQPFFNRPRFVLNKLKIHHPLPLNPRESKQLLNLLTTSFRQQLDSEHASIRIDSNANAPKEYQSARGSRRSSFSDLEKTPTDRHMHSILTNPLFGNSTINTRDDVVVTQDPMYIFSQAVARGMMTTKYAMACLRARKTQIVRSSVLNVRDGMKDSGAGLQVLKWLVSSGMTNSIDFLQDEAFIKIMMEFMVAEGLQEVAWKWVKKSLNSSPDLLSLSDEEFTQIQRKVVGPLLYLVKAEAGTADSLTNLDAAYMTLSRAASCLGGSPKSNMAAMLGPPGWFLIRASQIPRSSPPSEAAFESFLSLVPILSRSPARNIAHLSLLHPTKPNPDLALDYIRSVDATRNGREDSLHRSSASNDQSIIQLGLDTAQCLLEQHRYSEADEVMEFLRRNYPNQLGIKEIEPLEQAKAKASSLQLLESLGFA